MPNVIVTYVRWVDTMNYGLGRIVMYMIFVMIGILFWSSVSKTFFHPSLWTLEMAQFLMVAYYLLGGGYSLQIDSHVRMDLLYSRWSPTTSQVHGVDRSTPTRTVTTSYLSTSKPCSILLAIVHTTIASTGIGVAKPTCVSTAPS